MIKKLAVKILPWVLTVVALYFAFHGIDWTVLKSHLGSAKRSWIGIAVLLTCLSYLFRSRRWQDLFPHPTLDYVRALEVLVLGFFMNNVLPARAGELVRAHMGSKVSGETRTLVLATVATERLADGLTISIMFLFSSVALRDADIARGLTYVSWLFAAATLGVVATIVFQNRLLSLARTISGKIKHKASEYTLNRLELFIKGLSPLCNLSKLPLITLWSALIWITELGVYVAVGKAFGASLTTAQCIIFLVTVNFSSLIPAAPGGIGVIEAFGTAVLVSMGVEKEHALSMVLSQHAIQYLVVGIPGALIMATWRSRIREIREEGEGLTTNPNEASQTLPQG